MKLMVLASIACMVGCITPVEGAEETCENTAKEGLQTISVSAESDRYIDGALVIERELPIHYVTGIDDSYPCATASWTSGFGCTEEGQCISKCRVTLTLTGCSTKAFEVKLRTLE